jgi:predicted RNA binding protein YcfA (HicA-like mRNA interferase family)
MQVCYNVFKVSQEGSHTKWKHLSAPKITVILSGQDGDDAKPYQEKAVREFLLQIAKGKRSTQLSSTHPVERDGLVKRSGLPPGNQQGQLRN